MPPVTVALPADRIVHTMVSPGFAAAAPHVANADLIPEHLRQALSKSWHKEQPPRAVTFYSLLDVFVVGEGLVFDRDLNLFQPSITQLSPAAVDEAFELLQDRLRNGTVERLKGPLLLCGKAGLNNYGHWLAEMLPRVHVSAPWIDLEDGWRVLVPKVYPWMQAVVEDSLDLLGAGAGRRVLSDGGPCEVSDLVFIEGLSQHGDYFSPLVIGAMDRVAASMPAGPDTKLWITRDGELRSLLNEAEANMRIEAAGWRVVHPGQISFREQVILAKGARHMTGVNGAGLSNLVFMPPGGTLTSFVPAVMPDVFYWQLSFHRGLAYREIRSTQFHELGGPTPWDAPLAISIDDVLRHLTQVSDS